MKNYQVLLTPTGLFNLKFDEFPTLIPIEFRDDDLTLLTYDLLTFKAFLKKNRCRIDEDRILFKGNTTYGCFREWKPDSNIMPNLRPKLRLVKK